MFKFGKSVFVGLFEAFKTDVNVFLIGIATPFLIVKKFKGVGFALLFYTSLRRIDDLMGAYIQIKSQEIAAIRESNGVRDGR